MAGFIDFMNGPLGRGARALQGLAVIYIGFVVIGGTTGYLVAAVGVVPIAMGVVGRCLIEFVMPSTPRTR
ncbi:MAG: DUF2892 domain-containing protein [Dehalococcoidia bacterium]|nr:DUF2892 domain-containing protein [Dehalococcoidia bacterium]